MVKRGYPGTAELNNYLTKYNKLAEFYRREKQMKKTLVILVALVCMLGIAIPAFAAGPFADVPAKHWAYDAITSLGKAGIIDGIGDGTFAGDRTMTRYEVAMIVGRAMEKEDKADAQQKALIEKLAKEFAVELSNLGVRVTKLEAKTNFRIQSETWMQQTIDNTPGGTPTDVKGNDRFEWRERLYLYAAVSPNTDFFGRVQTAVTKFGVANASFQFDRVNFSTAKVFGFDKVIWGRQGTTYGQNFVAYRGGSNDGVTFYKQLNDTVNLQMGAYTTGATNDAVGEAVGKGFQIVNLGWKIDPSLKFNTAAYQYNGAQTAATSPWNVGWNGFKGLETSFAKTMGQWTLIGDYAQTDVTLPVRGTGTVADTLSNHPKAWAAQITNGTFKPDTFYPSSRFFVDYEKANTDAWALSYRYIQNGVIPTGNGPWTGTLTQAPNYLLANKLGVGGNPNDNLKGWELSYEKVLMKGLVLSLTYQDLKRADTGAQFDRQFQSQFIAVF